MSEPAGSLLVRYGLLRREQLAVAEQLRLAEGGTLGECLIRLGIVDEERLADFYHKRLMVPRLDATAFARIDRAALRLLPKEMALEFHIIPVHLDDVDRVLTVAMSDPSDTHVVDEIMFFTERFVQRAVATESLIRAAIERLYGVRLAAPAPSVVDTEWSRRSSLDDTQPRIPEPPLPPLEEPDPVVLLTQVKRSENTPLPAPLPVSDELPDPEADEVVDADELLRVDESPSFDDDDEDTLALPGLDVIELTQRKSAAAPPVTLEAEGSAKGPILLDRPRRERKIPTLTGMPILAIPDPPLARLRAAGSRDEVAATLLDYLAQMAPRSALFVIRKGMLAGFGGAGAIDAEAVRRVEIPTDAPSLFRDVVQSRLPYRGPLPESPANTAFAQELGTLPGDVLLLPVSVGDRVIALAYADGIASALPDAALHAVTREAGQAYQRLILESRRR